MSKISIALCTYNGESFLSEQLESFVRQTRLPDELVIGDDCSNDKTVKIIEDFAKAASFPVRLKTNEKNLGSTENFAQTISRCSGDIIFLSDQDDIWLPEKIERLMTEFADSPNVGLVFSDAEIVDKNLASLNHKLSDLTFSPQIRQAVEEKSFFEFLLLRNYVTGATMAFRAKFRDKCLPIPLDIPEMIHDAWITFVVVANADFRFVDEVLVKYRQHDRQQLGIFVKNDFENPSRNERYAKVIALSRQTKTRVEKFLREINERPQMFAQKDLIETIASKEIYKLEQRISHHEMRKNLPRLRVKRIVPVIEELFSGRYHKISKGFLSAAKDLFGNI